MRRILLLIHIAIALGLQLTGYCSLLSPQRWGIVSLAGYAMPVMLLLTLASMALAVCTRKRHLAVPVISLLVAYGPVSLYMPLHPTEQQPEEGALRVMTYNTHNWGQLSDGGNYAPTNDGGRSVMQYVADQQADIVCLQEASLPPLADDVLTPVYPHRDKVQLQGAGPLIVMSRHPILRHEKITDSHTGNGAAAFWLNIDGRETIVINAHLRSTGLSLSDRSNFRKMMKGESKKAGKVSRSVASRLLRSTRLRVPQAEAIATFIRRHSIEGRKGSPIIVMGDFNDIPNSYVHHLLASQLTDCYEATGTGPGWSFSHYGMRVRIDNALASDHFTPHAFRVDKDFAGSDHYALTGWLSIE